MMRITGSLFPFTRALQGGAPIVLVAGRENHLGEISDSWAHDYFAGKIVFSPYTVRSFLLEERGLVVNILVTGGAGFIGSHLVRAWKARGARVRVLDNFRTGKRSNLDGVDVDIIEGSVTDAEAVRAGMRGVQVVHHLAALVSVPESVEKPIECENINVIGTILLLEEAIRQGVKAFVFSSSSAVYGNVDRPLHSETDLPAPASPYAISKLAGEHYLHLAQGATGLRTVSLRYFNVFGPRQDPTSPYAAAVSIFFARAIAGRRLTIFGDGNQTRDFIYVSDVVEANLLAAERGEGVYNVAAGRRITINDLAQTIKLIAQSSSPLEYAEERPGDVRHSRGNIERLSALGWKPRVSLEEGLRETYLWMKNQNEVNKHA
jgi:UDP-glucose 4-epimerase